jgi:hypothetical protein
LESFKLSTPNRKKIIAVTMCGGYGVDAKPAAGFLPMGEDTSGWGLCRGSVIPALWRRAKSVVIRQTVSFVQFSKPGVQPARIPPSMHFVCFMTKTLNQETAGAAGFVGSSCCAMAPPATASWSFEFNGQTNVDRRDARGRNPRRRHEWDAP